jgi:hypothetical protein
MFAAPNGPLQEIKENFGLTKLNYLLAHSDYHRSTLSFAQLFSEGWVRRIQKFEERILDGIAAFFFERCGGAF